MKKLKILNERQKLEELETVMKTRSFSLDIPDSQSVESVDTLTRSQSEGCAVHQDQIRPKKDLLTAPVLTSSPLHSSNESNETPERRNLKSILKKLSEDTKEQQLPPPTVAAAAAAAAAATATTVASMPEKIDSTEFRK